mgnify:CR=1 FL=1
MIKTIWDFIKGVLEPFARAISSIVNFILLSIVYFIGIGPVSVLMKLFGKHFLELKKHNRKSNWDDHKVTKQPLEQYYRTF